VLYNINTAYVQGLPKQAQSLMHQHPCVRVTWFPL